MDSAQPQVALVLRGPSQYGKTTFVNGVDCQGQPMATGDGSGESVTAATAARQTCLGVVVDGPGDNDSKLQWSNEEIGRRFAVAAAATEAERLKFLLFESFAADSVQIRLTMASLVAGFGAPALRGAVVVATKPDLRPGEAGEMRLAAIRAAAAEKGVREIVTWQGVGLDHDASQAQVERLRQALARVPGVPTAELEDLWQRTRRLAAELCEREPPKTKLVEVEEQAAVAYTEPENYTEQEPYTATETYQAQEPYMDTEQYTEQEPYTAQEQYTEQVPYTEMQSQPVQVPVTHTKRRGGIAGLLGETKSWTEMTTQYVQVPVQKLRSEPRTRSVTKYQNVTKTRQVQKYRTVTKQRPVTKYRSVTKTRTVTKYRQESRTVTQPVEYKLPLESFLATARAQILEEARRQFAA